MKRNVVSQKKKKKQKEQVETAGGSEGSLRSHRFLMPKNWGWGDVHFGKVLEVKDK